MEPQVFARQLIARLVKYLAELPWVVSAARKDEWAEEALRRIENDGPFYETENELYCRIMHPQCGIAALLACAQDPSFHALETILSRLYWTAAHAEPPMPTEAAYEELHRAARHFGVYQLRFVPHGELRNQIELVARTLRLVNEDIGETLLGLAEDEILCRLEQLPVESLSEEPCAA